MRVIGHPVGHWIRSGPSLFEVRSFITVTQGGEIASPP
jgi:hypothetical protein